MGGRSEEPRPVYRPINNLVTAGGQPTPPGQHGQGARPTTQATTPKTRRNINIVTGVSV